MLYKNNGWEEYASIPGNLAEHCQVTVGEDVFLIGGLNGKSAASAVYKLSNGIVTKYHSIKTPRYRHMCAVLGGHVVVISGRSEGGRHLNSVEVLTPGSDDWVEGPALPENVEQGQSVVFNNSLYVLGGRSSGSGDGINYKIYRLDSVGGQWVTEDVSFGFPARFVFPAPLLYDHQLYCN